MKTYITFTHILIFLILCTSMPLIRAASTLSAGGSSAAAVEGALALTWGHNNFSQLGHSPGVTAVARPTLLAGEWRKVAMGTTFALGLAQDGKLYAWGANDEGQLGGGNVSSTPTTAPSPVALPDGAEVIDFVVGQRHGLALVNLPAVGSTPAVTGALFAWGSNAFGQLGQGKFDLTRKPTPVRVLIGTKTRPLSVTKIAATDLASFAIASNRTLWSWGGNQRGELGRGAKLTPRNQYSGIPARVGSGSTWTDIVGGSRHVLALRGKLLAAWGDNAFAQCAQPLKRGFLVAPVAVALPKDARKIARLPTAISAGQGHSLVLTSTGEVLGFGLRLNGALGAFDPALLQIHHLKPALISLPGPVSQIAAGADYSLFRLSAGNVVAMGGNQFGQLGNGEVRADTMFTDPVVTLLGGPVLTVNQPLVTEKRYGVGASVGPLTLTVRNGGSAPQTNSYRVSLYLATSTTLSADSRLLASVTQSLDLAAASSSVVEFSAVDLVLSNVAPGAYHLISQVTPLDETGAVSDDFRPHAGSSAAFEVVGPDLTTDGVITLANNLISEETPRLGSVSVNVRNANLGAIPAGAIIVVEAYLSGDTILHQASDTLLKRIEITVPAGGLAPGEALRAQLGDLDISGRTIGGNYHLLVAINREAGITESGTAANIVHLPIRVAAHDLSVTRPVLPEGGVGFASTLENLVVNVQNLGEIAYDAPAGFTVELFVSDSAEFSFAAQKLSSVASLGALAPNAGRLVQFPAITLPVTLKGSVYFHARVVADASLGDRFPGNNIASIPVTLADAILEIGDFNFPNTTSVEAGGSLGNVSYRLSNQGLGVLPVSFPVGFEVYLSEDDILERDRDTLLDRYTYADGLGAGASKLLPLENRKIDIPAGLANGLYQIIFTINTDGSQPGLPSATTMRSVSVGVLDATIVGPTLTGTALGTNTVIPSIGVSIGNEGGFPIPSGIAVEIYLSSDDQFDTADDLVVRELMSEPLAGKTTRTVTFSDVPLGDIGQGDYYMLARLLLPAGLVDLDYENNVSSTFITISRPTVVIDDVVTPAVVDLDIPDAKIKNVSFVLANTSLGAIPVGAELDYEIYLSRDDVLDPSDLARPPLLAGRYQGGLTGTYNLTGSRYALPVPVDLSLPEGLVGGTWYLLVVVNREGKVTLAMNEPVVAKREILLNNSKAAGAALDYGQISFSGTAPWRFVTDIRASNTSALQSPRLEAGQFASVNMTVTGPTEVRAPWNLFGAGGDSVAVSIDGVGINMLSTLDSVYRLSGPGGTPVTVPDGTHTVTWTYQQATANSGNFSRLDLDIPAFLPSGDGDWFGYTPGTAELPAAKVGTSYARSPELGVGQQAALEVNVLGPALVTFWWRAQGEAGKDTLAFYIDGELANLPTYNPDSAPIAAIISNQPEWRKVAFLVEDGMRTLRWVYNQNSSMVDALGAVDGLVVSNPIPAVPSPNNTTIDPVTLAPDPALAGVPSVTVDLAIRSVAAPFGTYLLDDAISTSRLPVRVSFVNIGRRFVASPSWSAADLELRFSTDQVWGNADDQILGSFARFQVIENGDELIFDADLNLPFTTPDGSYFLLARVRDQSGAGEFTLSNNTAVLGDSSPGNSFVITRAPNLVVTSFTGLANNHPYRPEDAVFVYYNVANTGLGDLQADQPFKVRLSLYGFEIGDSGIDVTKGKLIRDYPDIEVRTFLPSARAAFPDSATVELVHTLDIPSQRDVLVALGYIDPGTPEDEASVSALIPLTRLTNTAFYFSVDLDVDKQVAESSETNLVYIDQFFSIYPVPFEQNAASAITPVSSGVISGFGQESFDYTTLTPGAGSFTKYIWDYALYRAPQGSPNLLFQEGQQNGVSKITVPEYGSTDFQTISFDFNVRANDVVIFIQATDDGAAGGVWETVEMLQPPYNLIFGPNSLTGYGGLSSQPHVVSVSGNVSAVQKVHAARVTVRDRLPLVERGLANNPRMRMVVQPRPEIQIPVAPTNLRISITAFTIVIRWQGSLPVSAGGRIQGDFIVERSINGEPFRVIATTTGNAVTLPYVVTPGSNVYRVRALTSAGSSAPITFEFETGNVL